MEALVSHPQKNGPRELKTVAYVMHRTNYGEADRIVNFITPEGKVAAIAKGVRRPKSKLAGGVEMLTRSEIMVHFGKSELGVVTSAKMLKYHGGILKDYGRMELATAILKRMNAVSENSDAPEYYKIVDQCLGALEMGASLSVVEAWCELNVMRALGVEPNLYRNADGELLRADERYDWNEYDGVMTERPGGEYGADEIKLMRLMMTADLSVVLRVRGLEGKMVKILKLVKSMVQ